MKTLTSAAIVAFVLVASGAAAEFKGFVEDSLCSNMAGMNNDAQCAQKCIKAGKDGVLMGDDGKVYKIADQAKIVAHAGTTSRSPLN
ncbi:MAG TPA: hypothetical protein VG273_02965 [Bryobacteraceae bacterium]|jgi:hypothetical protein|nr:hypothetical protein [Bryobacteraceae bacterium]